MILATFPWLNIHDMSRYSALGMGLQQLGKSSTILESNQASCACKARYA